MHRGQQVKSNTISPALCAARHTKEVRCKREATCLQRKFFTVIYIQACYETFSSIKLFLCHIHISNILHGFFRIFLTWSWFEK